MNAWLLYTARFYVVSQPFAIFEMIYRASHHQFLLQPSLQTRVVLDCLKKKEKKHSMTGEMKILSPLKIVVAGVNLSRTPARHALFTLGQRQHAWGGGAARPFVPSLVSLNIGCRRAGQHTPPGGPTE